MRRPHDRRRRSRAVHRGRPRAGRARGRLRRRPDDPAAPAGATCSAASRRCCVLEDVHWADGATLDALRYLVRRTGALPSARSSPPTAPRRWPPDPRCAAVLGELASAPAHDAARAARRSPATACGADRARPAGRRPRPGCTTRPAATRSSSPRCSPPALSEVPATVRDAVLARTAPLAPRRPRARPPSRCSARGARLLLVAVVAGCSERDVADCVANGAAGRRATTATPSVTSSRAARSRTRWPSDERRRAAPRALYARRCALGGDDRRLAHHAIGCGDGAAVLRACSPGPAARAARLGAHREAAEHFRAGAALSRAEDPAERADLLESLSYECYLTEQLDGGARRPAAAAGARGGRRRRRAPPAPTLRWLSRLSWYLGRNADGRALRRPGGGHARRRSARAPRSRWRSAIVAQLAHARR